jgi:DNA-binding NarL/FixJ family response regulator
MDGVEATRLVKKARPAAQVIVLTSYHDDEHIFRPSAPGPVLRAQRHRPDELAEAIRRAKRGEAVITRAWRRAWSRKSTVRARQASTFSELTDASWTCCA